MGRQFVVYGGTVFPSDSAPTPNTAVERDGSGNASFAQVGGNVAAKGLLLTVVTYTATATIGTDKSLILLDATAAAFTATLPPAATVAGQTYLVTKIDGTGNLPTVKGSGSELIVTPGVGAGANTYTGLSAQGAFAVFTSDGTGWRGGKLT